MPAVELGCTGLCRCCGLNLELMKALRAMLNTHGLHGPCREHGCKDCCRAHDQAQALLWNDVTKQWRA